MACSALPLSDAAMLVPARDEERGIGEQTPIRGEEWAIGWAEACSQHEGPAPDVRCKAFGAVGRLALDLPCSALKPTQASLWCGGVSISRFPFLHRILRLAGDCLALT